MKEKNFIELIQKNEEIMGILEIIHELSLKDAWLCAGTIRNYIWDTLSQSLGRNETSDVDVVFYDSGISYEETIRIEKKLKKEYPNYLWELKNEVYMHIHNPDTLPYKSARDAINKFPEKCTAIALRLNQEKQIEVYAPYGLEELCAFRVSPTPHFLENKQRMATFAARINKKDWQSKWPAIKIEHLEDDI